MPDSSQDNPNKQQGTPGRVARVAIVGTGLVGATTAYALLLSGTVAEIVLIDRDKRRAEGHANDLRDAALFSHNAKVLAGEFSDCYDADVTVITAGVSQSVSNYEVPARQLAGECIHSRGYRRGDCLPQSAPIAGRLESRRCTDLRGLEVVRSAGQLGHGLGHKSRYFTLPQKTG